MKVPKLNSCCCGCSLRTGTLILGWLGLAGILVFSDEVFGSEQRVTGGSMSEFYRDFPVLRAIEVTTFLLYAVVSAVLLAGVYMSKRPYVLFYVYSYLVLTVISIGIGLVGLVYLGFWAATPGILIALALNLYFICVVYNFSLEMEGSRIMA